jgi:hypothetical protein
LFENQSLTEVKFGVEELIDAREYVVENLTRDKKNDSQPLDLYSSQPAEVRLIAYKFLIENFNKKYSNLLPDQKRLLKEYITNVSNTNKFTEFVNLEYKRVSGVLKENVSKVINNDVIKIKLNETITQLSNKAISGLVKENQLTSLLTAYELVEELNKIQNEKIS